MSDKIKTKHIKYEKRFYFFLAEKVCAIFMFLFSSLMFSIVYLSMYVLFNKTIPPELGWPVAFLMVLPTFLVMVYFFIWPAYCRGKFLRNNGFCILTPDTIEAHYLGKIEQYDYKDRTIKTKTRKDGSVDIFIGKSFLDVFKHSSLVFTRKFFKANNALRGFGAPLYRVTNSEEVLAYLKANN